GLSGFFLSCPLVCPHAPLTLSPWSRAHPALHSFPTRRSSDLKLNALALTGGQGGTGPIEREITQTQFNQAPSHLRKGSGQTCCQDRKSTRLNSSHVSMSYAVFCLK